jgi:hypothetical protein
LGSSMDLRTGRQHCEEGNQRKREEGRKEGRKCSYLQWVFLQSRIALSWAPHTTLTHPLQCRQKSFSNFQVHWGSLATGLQECSILLEAHPAKLKACCGSKRHS